MKETQMQEYHIEIKQFTDGIKTGESHLVLDPDEYLAMSFLYNTWKHGHDNDNKK